MADDPISIFIDEDEQIGPPPPEDDRVVQPVPFGRSGTDRRGEAPTVQARAFGSEPERPLLHNREFEPGAPAPGQSALEAKFGSGEFFLGDEKAAAIKTIPLAMAVLPGELSQEEMEALLPGLKENLRLESYTELFDEMSNGWKDMKLSYSAGMLGYAMIGDIIKYNPGSTEPQGVLGTYEFPEGRYNVDATVARIQEMRGQIQGRQGEGILNKISYGVANQLGLYGRSALETAPAALGAGMAAATAAFAIGQTPPLIAAPEEAITLPLTFVGGAALAMKVGMAVNLTKFSIGNMIADLIEMGIDPKLAMAIGVPFGTGIGLIEQSQLSELTRLLPGGAGTFGKVLERAAVRLLGPDSQLLPVLGTLARAGGAFVQEEAEEGLQEILSIIGENLGAELSNEFYYSEIPVTTFGPAVERVVRTMMEAAAGLGPLVGFSSVAGSVSQAQRARLKGETEGDAENEPTLSDWELTHETFADDGTVERLPGEEPQELRDDRVTLDLASEEKQNEVASRIESVDQLKDTVQQLQRDVGNLRFDSFEEFERYARGFYEDEVQPTTEDLEALFDQAVPAVANNPRVFYRGTNPGDSRRIDSPAGSGRTFVARREESARLYGSSIQRLEAKPEARILYEGTDEYRKLTGRGDDIFASLKPGEDTAPAAIDAVIEQAESAGYDAVSFSRDSDIGTVIINDESFIAEAAPVPGGEQPRRDVFLDPYVEDLRARAEAAPEIDTEESFLEETRATPENLEADLERGVKFESAEEFIEFANVMYDPASVPSSAELTAMFDKHAEDASFRSFDAIEAEFVEIAATREWVEDFAQLIVNTPKGTVRGLSRLWWSAGDKLSPARVPEWLRAQRPLDTAEEFASGREGGGGISETQRSRLIAEVRNNPSKFMRIMATMERDPDSMQEWMEALEPHEAAERIADFNRKDVAAGREQEKRAKEILKPLMVGGGPVKSQIHKTTGFRRPESLVSEYEALRAGLRKSQAAGDEAQRLGEIATNRAEKAGYRRGVEVENARQKEIKKQLAANQAARAEVRSDISSIKKSLANLKKWAPELKKEAESLTGGIDLVWKRQDRTLARLKNISALLDADMAHDLPLEVLESLKILEKTPFSEMQSEQIADLSKALQTLAYQNQEKQKVRTEKKAMALEQAVNETVGDMKPPPDDPGLLYGNSGSGAERAALRVSRIFGMDENHLDTLGQQMFGMNTTGYDITVRSVKSGMVNQMGAEQAAFDSFHASLEEKGFSQSGSLMSWHSEKVDIPGFEVARPGENPNQRNIRNQRLTVGQRIAVYMHAQDPDNLKAMLTGGIGFREGNRPNTPYRITQQEVDAIIESMTDDELIFAEATHDLFQRQGAELSATFERINGWAPELREFYYPKEVMGVNIDQAGLSDAQSTLDNLRRQNHRVGVEKSFLISRAGSTQAIYLNDVAFDINRSVLHASAYNNLEESLSMAHKVLTDKKVRKAMGADVKGAAQWHVFDRFYRDIAGQHEWYGSLEQWYQSLRGGLTKYALGLNPKVAIQQVFSVPFASMYMSPKYLAYGFANEGLHPRANWQEHTANDPKMHSRVRSGYSPDIAQAIKTHGERVTVLHARRTPGELLLSPARFTDRHAVSAIYTGAVKQVQAEVESGKLSKQVLKALDPDESLLKRIQAGELTAEETKKLGYEFGHFVVDRTQPQFSAEHLSQHRRKTELGKQISLFSSFTNQENNMLKRALNDAKGGDYRPLVAFSASFIANIGLMAGLDFARAGLVNAIRGDDEKEAKLLVTQLVESLSGMFVATRAGVSAALRTQQTGVSASAELPVQRTIDRAVRGLAALFTLIDPTSPGPDRRKAIGQLFDATIDVLSMWKGIPRQIPESVKGLRQGEGIFGP